jgi:hypothetical protein
MYTTQTIEGIYKYKGDSCWSVRPERVQLLVEENIPKEN